MVGGTVIGVSRRVNRPTEIGGLCDSTDSLALLNVRGVGTEKNETRTVRVDERLPGGRAIIQVGDSVWWQCGKLMWNPKDLPEYAPRDTQLSLLWHS